MRHIPKILLPVLCITLSSISSTRATGIVVNKLSFFVRPQEVQNGAIVDYTGDAASLTTLTYPLNEFITPLTKRTPTVENTQDQYLESMHTRCKRVIPDGFQNGVTTFNRVTGVQYHQTQPVFHGAPSDDWGRLILFWPKDQEGCIGEAKYSLLLYPQHMDPQVTDLSGITATAATLNDLWQYIILYRSSNDVEVAHTNDAASSMYDTTVAHQSEINNIPIGTVAIQIDDDDEEDDDDDDDDDEDD